MIKINLDKICREITENTKEFHYYTKEDIYQTCYLYGIEISEYKPDMNEKQLKISIINRMRCHRRNLKGRI